MHLILGGAYQGKLAYARERFQLRDADIYTCTGSEIDFSFPCIHRLEEFTLACAREGKDPTAIFQANADRWAQSVLICQDIFCGVVPLEPELRIWRNITGQLCQYLSRNARQVSRIFCGLEQRLK